MEIWGEPVGVLHPVLPLLTSRELEKIIDRYLLVEGDV